MYSYLPPKISQSLEKSYLTPQVKNKYLLLDKEKDATKLESYSAFTTRNNTPKKKASKSGEGSGASANPEATTTAALQTVKNILSTKLFTFKAGVLNATTATDPMDQLGTRFRYKGNKVMIEDIWDVKNSKVVTDPDIIKAKTEKALKVMQDISLTDGINKIVEANQKAQFEDDFMLFDPTPKKSTEGGKKGPKGGANPLASNENDNAQCPPPA